MGRKSNVLTEVERGEKRQKLGSEVISGIIEVNIKVAGDDEFMRCGSAKERKELKSSRKTENGLESVDEEGGRYMLNTDSLEREIWRVMEDDSKDEKSGREVGSCVKGSRMRKSVPPPVQELLPECLRVTLRKV